jgi:ABC-type glycerol-3-phosphate transport system substrate-binding protein
MLVAEKALTKLDPQGNISQSTLALGEFANNKNAKDILATLILQAGNPIASLDASDKPQVSLGLNAASDGLAPARSAVDFFTQFANPAKTTYTWNRSLPEASAAFINGTLAFYLGFGSELPSLSNRNPHLFFDLAPVPQRNDPGARSLTFGRFTGLAVSVQSQKAAYALQAIQALAGPTYAARLAALAGAAPVRRDLLATGSTDPKQAVIFKSALFARAWFDPNPIATKKIFSDMISSIMTGLADSGQALTTASLALSNLFIIQNSNGQ